MMRIHAALLAFVLMAAASALHAEDKTYPWQPRRDKEGIRIDVRKVEGSPILEYRGAMTVGLPLDKVTAFFERDEKIAEWFHNCKQARLVREESPERKILYFELEMPWPVANRDAVYVRTRTREEGGAAAYTIAALPDELPREKGKIRMPYLKGTWRFSPVDAEHTEIYLQQHGDAAGHLPAVLINRLAVDIPFHTLQNFRASLKKAYPDSAGGQG